MAVIDLDNKYCNSSLVNGVSCILRKKILIFIHYHLQCHLHLSPFINTYYVQLHTSSHKQTCGPVCWNGSSASTAALGSGDPSFTSGSVNWLFYRNPPVLSEMPLSRVPLCLFVLYLYPQRCTVRALTFHPAPYLPVGTTSPSLDWLLWFRYINPLGLFCSLLVVDYS